MVTYQLERDSVKQQKLTKWLQSDFNNLYIRFQDICDILKTKGILNIEEQTNCAYIVLFMESVGKYQASEEEVYEGTNHLQAVMEDNYKVIQGEK